MQRSIDQTAESIERLLDLARGGSPKAVGELLEYFRPYLLQIALRELGPDLQVKESPSDLVQNSFLEAAVSFREFAGNDLAALQAWLRRILIHNVRDARNRFNTEKREISREVGRVQDVAALLPADITPPTQALIRQEQISRLQRAIVRLGDESRQLIWMRNRDRRSYADIAKELGITEIAARKRWVRAVEELRELMRDDSPNNLFLGER
jgi:RNA polymerase sigma-70 factor (ECF subfamily)